MSLLSYFFPQTIEEINSPVNGHIKVIKLLGSRYISVGGLSQSGGLVKNLWETGLKQLNNVKQCNNVLVLGVGGGTVIKLLNQYYPTAQITGVELDPTMIELGQKYFGLSENINLKIIISNAIKWIIIHSADSNLQYKYDLILVDLYLGQKIPEGLTDNKFLNSLKKLLTKDGIVIFNLLRNKKNDVTLIKINKIFSKVKVYKPLVNYLVYCHA